MNDKHSYKLTMALFLVGSILFAGMVFWLTTKTAGAGEYLHQQEDYLNAIEDSKNGEWYEMRIKCQPNAEFKNDRCMRGMVVGHLTEALRAAYYISAEDLDWIALQYAGTKFETMFETRIVEVSTTKTVTKPPTEEELDAMLGERLLLLFSKKQ